MIFRPIKAVMKGQFAVIISRMTMNRAFKIFGLKPSSKYNCQSKKKGKTEEEKKYS